MFTVRTVTAALALVLTASLAPAHPARADEPRGSDTPPAGAPVTRADRVTVAADSAADVDVLANDTDPDGDGDALTVCRVDADPAFPVGISPSMDFDVVDGTEHPTLFVYPHGARPGTYTFDYYVCDYDYLTPATLTVKVIGRQNAFVRKLADRPGFVRFHNPGKRRTVIQYGSADGRTVDGRFVLEPRTARTVRIERRSIQWVATVRTRHGSWSVGSILTGIKQPARRTPPATSDRSLGRSQADATAWRVGTRQVEMRARSGASGPSPTATSPTAGRDESTDAPVTGPDTAEVSQGFFAVADVLDNDSDPDGSDGSDLRICRATVPPRSGLYAEPLHGDGTVLIAYPARRVADDALPDSLFLMAGRRTPVGTYEVTYYACDTQYLTPATVTVTVTESQFVTARKVGSRRGAVRFTNPGPHGATVVIRDFTDYDIEDRRPPLVTRFKLPGGTSHAVRLHVRRIVWQASSRRGPGGYGFISGIGRAPRA